MRGIISENQPSFFQVMRKIYHAELVRAGFRFVYQRKKGLKATVNNFQGLLGYLSA